MKTFATLALLAQLCFAGVAAAQEKFPSRPIEVIVPWGAGGGADVLGRSVARWIESDLKVAAPVLNIPGASGMIGLGRLSQAPADGHTLAILTGDSLMMAATPQATYKFADAAAVAVLVRQPSAIFARTNSRYRTWQDVVAAVRDKPGSVTVAITGPNTADDLTVQYLASRKIEIGGIPFTRPGERYAAVLGGHVDLLYEQAGDVRAYLDAGQLRPLLFFANKRLAPPFADVPVSAEIGYEILLPQVRAVLARAGTDPARLAELSRSIERYAASPEYAAFIEQQLALPDSFMPAAAAQKFLQGELEASRRLLQQYGAK